MACFTKKTGWLLCIFAIDGECKSSSPGEVVTFIGVNFYPSFAKPFGKWQCFGEKVPVALSTCIFFMQFFGMLLTLFNICIPRLPEGFLVSFYFFLLSVKGVHRAYRGKHFFRYRTGFSRRLSFLF